MKYVSYYQNNILISIDRIFLFMMLLSCMIKLVFLLQMALISGS